MRKFQQQKILDMIQTLEEVCDEMLKQLSPEATINLLADCQNFAAVICGYGVPFERRAQMPRSDSRLLCNLHRPEYVEITGDDHGGITMREMPVQYLSRELQILVSSGGTVF